LRCGFAIARPDLLEENHGPGGLELYAHHRLVAASASLKTRA